MAKTIREATLDAIDFLAANPEQHIAMDMATTEFGAMAHPCSEKAKCWCLIGRIAHEMGYGEETPENFIFEYLDRDLDEIIDWKQFVENLEPTKILYRINDGAFRRKRDYTVANSSYEMVEREEGAKARALESARKVLR